MKNSSNYSKPTPTGEMVYNAVFSENREVDDLLAFYDAYMNKAASSLVFDSYGEQEGIFISSDLKQEIVYRFIRCLPILKRRILGENDSEESSISIIFP